jgi:hypothetical protein
MALSTLADDLINFFMFQPPQVKCRPTCNSREHAWLAGNPSDLVFRRFHR